MTDPTGRVTSRTDVDQSLQNVHLHARLPRRPGPGHARAGRSTSPSRRYASPPPERTTQWTPRARTYLRGSRGCGLGTSGRPRGDAGGAVPVVRVRQNASESGRVRDPC